MRTPSIWASATVLTGLALAGLCGTFFGWLGEEVLENDTVRLDSRVRNFVHLQAEAPLTRVMTCFTTIGSTVPVLILTGSALLIFWLRNLKRQAITLGLAILGAGALSYILKLSFHRVRPAPYFSLPVPATFSFPSGHSLVAATFYFLVAHLVCSRVESRRIRAAIWIFSGSMVLLIGFSRVYLGIHYASDVIAGYAAAIVWIAAFVIVERFVWVDSSSSVSSRAYAREEPCRKRRSRK